jgi:hypothetical protein
MQTLSKFLLVGRTPRPTLTTNQVIAAMRSKLTKKSNDASLEARA